LAERWEPPWAELLVTLLVLLWETTLGGRWDLLLDCLRTLWLVQHQCLLKTLSRPCASLVLGIAHCLSVQAMRPPSTTHSLCMITRGDGVGTGWSGSLVWVVWCAWCHACVKVVNNGATTGSAVSDAAETCQRPSRVLCTQRQTVGRMVTIDACRVHAGGCKPLPILVCKDSFRTRFTALRRL
jgi:hypothetical protein